MRATKTSQILPYSQYDSVDAEDLWAYMAAYEEKTGGRVLAAAHNGNFSNGLMFDTKTYGGDPLTTAYAQTRARFEPIYEVTQTKGDGETHPAAVARRPICRLRDDRQGKSQWQHCQDPPTCCLRNMPAPR